MTDFVSDFLTGWAMDFDANGLAVWEPSGVYDFTVCGIGLHGLLTDNPTCIGLSAYPLTEDPTLGIASLGIQVMARVASQDVRDVRALIGPIEEHVLGRYPITLPSGVRINTLTAGPSTSLGMDDSQRQIWASSYPCTAMRPTAHRL